MPIDDERPPDLVNLLHDQELYEENPAWKPFQPIPRAPGEAPKAAQPAAHPFPFGPAPSPPPYAQAAAPAPFTQHAGSRAAKPR